MKKQLLIFGSGPGISFATAKLFGTKGFAITLVSRTESKLVLLCAELHDKGIEADYIVGDVGDTSTVKRLTEKFKKDDQFPDLILYNVSSMYMKDMLEQEWSEYLENVNVTAGGAFHLLNGILPEYIKRGKGKLFFTGGGLALNGNPEMSTTSMGNAALRNLIQAAVKRVEGSSIHIAQLLVCGYVQDSDKKYNAAAIAQVYWSLFEQSPEEFDHEIIY